jgi:hypothetical protein
MTSSLKTTASHSVNYKHKLTWENYKHKVTIADNLWL